MIEKTSAETDRTLCLVSGYHQYSYPPMPAFEHGLGFRFAIVMDTYRRDKVDMYFDADLFLRLVTALCRAIGYETVDCRMADAGAPIHSFEALADYYAKHEEVDQEPPESIVVSRAGELVGYAETEFWTMIGGQQPYSDSYTVSLYTKGNRAEEFRRIAEAICLEARAEIRGVYTEQQRKEPYRSRWEWLFRWLGLQNFDTLPWDRQTL